MSESDRSFLDLQTRYMEELREQVHDLESLFLHWEKENDDRYMQKAMGILHSIKGTSGSYLLNELSSFAHRFEDLILDPKLRAEQKFSDSLFKLVDILASYINEFPRVSGKEILFSLESLLSKNELKQLKSCLVLEMSRSMIRVYSDVLTKYGFDVSSVSDAFSGVKRLTIEDFDLLVLSTNLNGFNGVSLYNAMYEIAPKKMDNTNILLVTTDPNKTKQLHGFRGDTVIKSNTLVEDLESWLNVNYGFAQSTSPNKSKVSQIKDYELNKYKKVFFIDDSASILGLAKHIFSKQSPTCDVSYFSDPKEALELIKSAPPELIICDYQMDGINGSELKKELNKSVKLQNIPFLFLTGETDQTVLKEFNTLGAQGLIYKPFNHQTLISEISKALVAA